MSFGNHNSNQDLNHYDYRSFLGDSPLTRPHPSQLSQTHSARDSGLDRAVHSLQHQHRLSLSQSPTPQQQQQQQQQQQKQHQEQLQRQQDEQRHADLQRRARQEAILQQEAAHHQQILQQQRQQQQRRQQRRQQQQRSGQPTPSSYWSVPDIQDFQNLLSHFGTN